MGALTGGPALGTFFALAAVLGGPRMLADALAVTVIGGAIGGLVGLVSAVLPGTAVALTSGYLREHPRIACAYAATISGLEIDLAFIVERGGLSAAAATSGGIAFLIFAFALFAAVGAYSLNYVITGRKCAPARRALRCLRRICPSAGPASIN